MRIVPALAGLAGCIFAPHAFAQAGTSLPASAQTISAIVVVPDHPLVGSGERFRRRADSAMADFYPIDGIGVHLSGGMRFFNNASFLRDAAKSTGGLLYQPRSLGNSGMRWGYRRTPAMAVGYTQSLDKDVVLGVEIGAMAGRATSPIRRFGLSGRRRDGGHGANSVVHLVLGFKF